MEWLNYIDTVIKTYLNVLLPTDVLRASEYEKLVECNAVMCQL